MKLSDRELREMMLQDEDEALDKAAGKRYAQEVRRKRDIEIQRRIMRELKRGSNELE